MRRFSAKTPDLIKAHAADILLYKKLATLATTHPTIRLQDALWLRDFDWTEVAEILGEMRFGPALLNKLPEPKHANALF